MRAIIQLGGAAILMVEKRAGGGSTFWFEPVGEQFDGAAAEVINSKRKQQGLPRVKRMYLDADAVMPICQAIGYTLS